jgi:crotonobetainyl-CoA:carnitine CoA-transferase CaiB-like acyl-CoA transferase
VSVSNVRPEALQRLELDAARVRAAHPRLIHCTITGFARTARRGGRRMTVSSREDVASQDSLASAMARRVHVPLLLCDHVVGEIAAGAIIAALNERHRTGLGSELELPMFETMAAFVLQQHLGAQSFSPAVGAAGDQRLLTPDNRPLQTQDGWLSLTTNTDAQVRSFLSAIGQDSLIEDERFRTVALRARHVEEWFALRREALRERTSAEWLAIFTAADVPAMPCHTPDSLVADPHLVAVGLLGSERHPTRTG